MSPNPVEINMQHLFITDSVQRKHDVNLFRNNHWKTLLNFKDILTHKGYR